MYFLFFYIASAIPKFQHTEYLSRIASNPKAEVVLFISPGWDEHALDPILHALWRSGFSVWFVKFPIHAQSHEDIQESIDTILTMHNKPLIVAQEFTGSIFLERAEMLDEKISGLALLGSPFSFFCSPAFVDSLQSDVWTIFDNPPIQKADPFFYPYLLEKCQNTVPTSFRIPITNLWAATTNTHPFAPPESIRPYLQNHHRFIRSGPLALHGSEPNLIAFYTHTPTINDLCSWFSQITKERKSNK